MTPQEIHAEVYRRLETLRNKDGQTFYNRNGFSPKYKIDDDTAAWNLFKFMAILQSDCIGTITTKACLDFDVSFEINIYADNPEDRPCIEKTSKHFTTAVLRATLAMLDVIAPEAKKETEEE